MSVCPYAYFKASYQVCLQVAQGWNRTAVVTKERMDRQDDELPGHLRCSGRCALRTLLAATGLVR